MLGRFRIGGQKGNSAGIVARVVQNGRVGSRAGSGRSKCGGRRARHDNFGTPLTPAARRASGGWTSSTTRPPRAATSGAYRMNWIVSPSPAPDAREWSGRRAATVPNRLFEAPRCVTFGPQAPFVAAPAIREIALDELGQREVPVRIGKFRVHSDGTPIATDRAADFIASHQRHAHVAMRRNMVGVVGQHPAIVLGRLLVSVEAIEEGAEIAQGIGMVGLQFERATIAFRRLGEPPALLQGESEPGMRIDQPGLRRDGLAIPVDRGVEIPLLAHQVAEVDMRRGIARSHLDRAP